MKRLLIAALFASALSLHAQQSIIVRDGETARPPIEREGPEASAERRAWLDGMHRTEPGLNWRAIDRETRLARAMRRGSATIFGNDTVDQRLGGRWIERGSQNCAGRIITADVDVERDILWAASAGGNIWRGTLDGTNWRSLNDSLRFSGIAMLRSIPQGSGRRLVVAHGGPAAVRFSDDDGVTWTEATGLEDIARWGWWRRGMTTDGGVILLAGAEWDYTNWRAVTTLYRSNDGGASFENVLQSDLGADLIDLWGDRSDDSLFLALGDSLYRVGGSGEPSLVGAIGFAEPVARGLHLVGAGRGDSATLYAMDRRAERLDCYRSTDGGRSWEKRDTTVAPMSSNSFAVSSADPNALFVGAVEVHRSYDAGGSFERMSAWPEYISDPVGRLHADIFGIVPFAESDGREAILICTDGGIYISRDTLRSVRNLSLEGLNVSQYYSTLTSWGDPGYLAAGSQDQGLQFGASTGVGALPLDIAITGDYGHLSSSDSGRSFWCNYPGFSMRVRRNGTENRMQFWTFQGKEGLWLPPIVAHPTRPDVAFVAAGGVDGTQNLWRLTANDTAIAHEMLATDFRDTVDARITAFAISPLDTTRWFVLRSDGALLRSTDAGETWVRSSDTIGPGGHYFYGASILPSHIDPARVIISGSGYSSPGVMLSSDTGRSFVPITEGLPQTLVYDIATSSDEQYIFAATEVGPFVYVVDLERWFDLGEDGAPDQTYWSVEYVPALRTARFGTYGRGIWDYQMKEVSSVERPGGTLTSIAVEATPNPSSGSLTVTVDAEAVVTVYDAEGRAVVAPRSGGRFSVEGLRSGVYTVVARSAGGVGFTRVVVVR